MNTKRFINFRYIFYPFLSFLFGIIVARGLYSGKLETILIVVLSLLALGIFLVIKKKYKILIILFSFFFLGNGFYFIGQSSYKVKDYDGIVTVTGRVSDNFEENKYSYVVILDNVTIDGEKAKNIKATFSKGSLPLEIGDFVTLETEVSTQQLFTLDSINSSNLRTNVGYTISSSTSDIVITTGYTYFDEDVRQAIKQQIYSNMSEDNAAIAYAVLFGDDSGISFEINQSYRNSGIIHIITVSGLNVAFLITLIYGFLKLCRCNKYLNVILTVVVILIYAYFCNFAPSIFRATIMGIIIMTAKLCGRRYDALNSLGLAGFVVLICSPLTAFDMGFLMSVACVCGIVLLNPVFNKPFSKCMPKIIAQYISVSLSAQLAILPFLAAFSSYFNLLSFIINLFVVPLFAVMYPYLFVLAFLSVLMPFLSFGYILVEWGLMLTYYVALIFSQTYLQIKLSPMTLGVTFFFFLILYVLSKFFFSRPANKFLLCASLVLCMTLSFGFTTAENMIKTGVFYLNSYGSESVMLVASGGQTMLIGDTYITERAMNKYQIDKINYYVSFDPLSSENTNNLDDYGVSYFICLEGEEADDDIHIVELDQPMLAGEFSFHYVSLDNSCLGIIVNFDQTSVFVASDFEIDYNNIDSCLSVVSALTPDICFVKENILLASDNFISVSSVKNSYTTYNYLSDGNLLFLEQSVGYKVRRLD